MLAISPISLAAFDKEKTPFAELLVRSTIYSSKEVFP